MTRSTDEDTGRRSDGSLDFGEGARDDGLGKRPAERPESFRVIRRFVRPIASEDERVECCLDGDDDVARSGGAGPPISHDEVGGQAPDLNCEIATE
jgi:hypothetical protein